jgi:predicted DNA-binding transcriptional regulator AlpA
MPSQFKSGKTSRTIEPQSSSLALNYAHAERQSKRDRILEQFDNLPDSALIRQPIVEALFSISSTTVWRWVNQKRLPMPKRHGARHIAWNVGEIRQALKGESK